MFSTEWDLTLKLRYTYFVWVFSRMILWYTYIHHWDTFHTKFHYFYMTWIFRYSYEVAPEIKGTLVQSVSDIRETNLNETYIWSTLLAYYSTILKFFRGILNRQRTLKHGFIITVVTSHNYATYLNGVLFPYFYTSALHPLLHYIFFTYLTFWSK